MVNDIVHYEDVGLITCDNNVIARLCLSYIAKFKFLTWWF